MSSNIEEKVPESALLSSTSSLSVGDYVSSYLKRIRAGDLGSLPIILGLLVIAVIFQTQNANYLTARNLVNLMVQMAGYTAIAIGVVYVLLLGEIDLSVGYVSAIGGVGMTILLRIPSGDPSTWPWYAFFSNGWPWYLAIAGALLLVSFIGLVHGLIITKFQVPSFVVTLAGFLVWNGVVLIMVGEGGTIVIQDVIAVGIASATLPISWGWILAALIVGTYAAVEFGQMSVRRNRGLATKPTPIILAQISGLAILTCFVIYLTNVNRGFGTNIVVGFPVVGVILLILLTAFTFLATRTTFGRYVYAVGGNMEAARRAGINVDRIRVTVFMISSFMAGVGGIILASRLRSVATDAGGGNLLLNSIAAAVIGGTSLFGGRGKVISALLGALVIASVENGMGLLGLPSGIKFIVTGSVLLLAVLVDSISRRGRAQSGLA